VSFHTPFFLKSSTQAVLETIQAFSLENITPVVLKGYLRKRLNRKAKKNEKSIYFSVFLRYGLYMSNIHDHKVNACRFDYEYLGKSPEELAAQYEFPIVHLKDEIELKGWVRKIEPTDMPDTSDIQAFADQLEKLTRSKLSIISLFRQIDNQSLYAEIERSLLKKILEVSAEVDVTDSKAASKLVSLAKAVQSIQEREPINLADSFKDALAAQGNGVVVNIANVVQ